MTQVYLLYTVAVIADRDYWIRAVSDPVVCMSFDKAKELASAADVELGNECGEGYEEPINLAWETTADGETFEGDYGFYLHNVVSTAGNGHNELYLIALKDVQ